jgi:hypothetical protein
MLLGRKPIGTITYLGGLPAVLERFCWSFAQLLVHSQETLCSPDEFIHADRAAISDHGPARNGLAARFLGDWLLMLDADHAFEPDLLVRLLHRMDANGLDVMTGFYQFKSPPYSPVLFLRQGENKFVHAIAKWPDGSEILKVDSAGAGCLLVRRKVFDRIRVELKEEPFNRVEGLSEDHSFFWRLHLLKIPAWCDFRVECNHLAIKAITQTDYDPDTLDSSAPIPVPGFRE